MDQTFQMKENEFLTAINHLLFVWAVNNKGKKRKPKRLQEKIPWEGEFRPKKRSVSWVNSVLRQFWSHGL